MKLKSLIAIVTLSLAMWAQTNAPAPKKNTPGPKAAASECACCKDGKCDMKDGASCPMMKDAKAACMGDKGCCGGMNHDNASHKSDMTSDGKMGAHCSMMTGKDGKKSCCGMCGSTGKASGK